jgi:hypothetical protein
MKRQPSPYHSALGTCFSRLNEKVGLAFQAFISTAKRAKATFGVFIQGFALQSGLGSTIVILLSKIKIKVPL